MGGDTTSLASFSSQEEELSVDPQLLKLSSDFPSYIRDSSNWRGIDDTADAGNSMVFDDPDKMNPKYFTNLLDSEGNRRRHRAYKEIIASYDRANIAGRSLEEARSRILSYTPGSWIEKRGGTELDDYDVPETMTLLLIGPKGSGKSSLINRITKVFEDEKFAPERAQVTYNPSTGGRTYFLQEYMVPRSSNSFCLYDTRSLSDDLSANIHMIMQWMIKGVHHGELVTRKSDDFILKARMNNKAHRIGSQSSVSRRVNFVIFVVDGLAVLKSMNCNGGEEKHYTQSIAATFNCSYLSFKDDKPVVAVTHGDLLSLSERAHVRIYLGELLGISPIGQIFDIPERCDSVAEVAIVDLLRYSLEHADRNLPLRVRRFFLPSHIWLLFALGIVIISLIIHYLYMHHTRLKTQKDWKDQLETHEDWTEFQWHKIRHLWLDDT